MFGRLRAILCHVAKSKHAACSTPRYGVQWSLQRTLASSKVSGHPGLLPAGESRTVSIGDVSLSVVPGDPKLVPRGRLGSSHTSLDDNTHASRLSQEMLAHLRWLMQKDALGQDVFLVGPPGPRRRQLAMLYCELVGKEYEMVSITRDTTESDLKQRREIVRGSALFSDQAPVRAALEGRVLILEGIEKAERNVLPTLNNLLENREMALDDGRFLMRCTRRLFPLPPPSFHTDDIMRYPAVLHAMMRCWLRERHKASWTAKSWSECTPRSVCSPSGCPARRFLVCFLVCA